MMELSDIAGSQTPAPMNVPDRASRRRAMSDGAGCVATHPRAAGHLPAARRRVGACS